MDAIKVQSSRTAALLARGQERSEFVKDLDSVEMEVFLRSVRYELQRIYGKGRYEVHDGHHNEELFYIVRSR